MKEKDDCVDPARYVELVRPFTPAPEDVTLIEQRRGLDPLSRKAAEEFDELIAKINKPPEVFEPL